MSARKARHPALDRLGGQEWQDKKSRVKEAVLEVAEEMLDLHARRAVIRGYAFKADTAWQAELEDSFPYVETQDQARALMDIKRDMEAPRPMDRLLCGDVGYGKTELALRAAFKAVMDGKQVAVLVPTTVLAQQHYETFLRAPRRISRQGRNAFTVPLASRAGRNNPASRTRPNRYRHRDSQAAFLGCAVQGPGAGHY